jgi:chitinase
MATLSTTSGARPQITLDVPGIFTGVLSVNDGKSESATDSVSITATAPVTSVLPLAKAGANQNVPVGTMVTLDGTASTAQSTKSLTYRWVFVSKPAGSALLSSTTAAKPSFIAEVAGTYTLGLVVNNSVADSAMATVVITASPPATTSNIAPVANAGMDQLVTTGATVNLDGTLSKDANGDRLSYTWTLLTKPAQSTAVLTSSFLGTTGFRADLSGTYEVRLSVNDGKVDSLANDLISIVAAGNAFVIADTGTYRCSALSRDQALALYAAGHNYLDRDHDGKPCEANDLLNEAASPYVAPAPSTGGQCWVNGYTRKNGTHVNGYFRRC